MITIEEKREQRAIDTEERLEAMNKERFIADNYCAICPMNVNYNTANHARQCPGCPKYAELQEVGETLMDISNRRFVPPETLNWTNYLLLKDREWENKRIAKHYGLGAALLQEFINRNKGKLADVDPADVEERTVIPKEFEIDSLPPVKKERKPKKTRKKKKARAAAVVKPVQPRKTTYRNTDISDKETKDLVSQAQQGSEVAEETLITFYDNLLNRTAKRFTGRGFEEEELKQVAALGFIKAVRKFDLTREVKFMTYMIPSIEGEVQKFLRSNGQVSVVQTITELVPKILKGDLLDSTPEHIVEVLGVKRELAVDTLRYIKDGYVESLDTPARVDDDGTGTTLKDTIASDVNGSDWFETLAVQESLSILTDKERQIITLRYYEGLNQPQVGEILGCSKASVGQHEKKALNKLKEHMEEENNMGRKLTGDREYAIELLKDTAMSTKEISEASGVPTGSIGKLMKIHRSDEVSKKNRQETGQRLAQKAQEKRAAKEQQQSGPPYAPAMSAPEPSDMAEEVIGDNTGQQDWEVTGEGISFGKRVWAAGAVDLKETGLQPPEQGLDFTDVPAEQRPHTPTGDHPFVNNMPLFPQDFIDKIQPESITTLGQAAPSSSWKEILELTEEKQVDEGPQTDEGNVTTSFYLTYQSTSDSVTKEAALRELKKAISVLEDLNVDTIGFNIKLFK